MPAPQPTVIANVLEALQSRRDIQIAILFGSLASSKYDTESDVDVAVDCGRPLTAHEKMALMGGVAEKTGRSVDLIDLRTVGEPTLGQILKHGIRILGTNASYAALIRKHLFDNADFMPYRKRILEARRRRWIGR